MLEMHTHSQHTVNIQEGVECLEWAGCTDRLTMLDCVDFQRWTPGMSASRRRRKSRRHRTRVHRSRSNEKFDEVGRSHLREDADNRLWYIVGILRFVERRCEQSFRRVKMLLLE